MSFISCAAPTNEVLKGENNMQKEIIELIRSSGIEASNLFTWYMALSFIQYLIGCATVVVSCSIFVKFFSRLVKD